MIASEMNTCPEQLSLKLAITVCSLSCLTVMAWSFYSKPAPDLDIFICYSNNPERVKKNSDPLADVSVY
jgi:hypothetical protein